MFVTPPYLTKGSTIAITCTAGYLPAANITNCVSFLKKQGYKVLIGNTVGGKSKNYFSGTDEERRADLQQFLDNTAVDAILCGRGGYGSSRIIDSIDFSAFETNPKWIIGFSDITVFHSFLYSNLQIASIHASMTAAFNNNGHTSQNVITLMKTLIGEKANYVIPHHTLNKTGLVKGRLIGGNLSLLANGIGTSSTLKTRSCILFLEDLGEQLYNIDRMMVQLKRAGMLKNLAGLVIGGFTDIKDTDRPFGKTVFEIMADAVKEYNYPVCYNFPTSHGEENVALKHGAKFLLSVTKNDTTLMEL